MSIYAYFILMFCSGLVLGITINHVLPKEPVNKNYHLVHQLLDRKTKTILHQKEIIRRYKEKLRSVTKNNKSK